MAKKNTGAAAKGLESLKELDGRVVPSLARARGTIRFDLAADGRTEHVRVALDRGRVSISRGPEPADCIVRTDKELFNDIAKGDANPLTAVLRGVLTCEGNAELLVLFRRALDEAATA